MAKNKGRTPAETERQMKRTRQNKISRIEKELKKHPKTENNRRMLDRLAELKGGKN